MVHDFRLMYNRIIIRINNKKNQTSYHLHTPVNEYNQLEARIRFVVNMNDLRQFLPSDNVYTDLQNDTDNVATYYQVLNFINPSSGTIEQVEIK